MAEPAARRRHAASQRRTYPGADQRDAVRRFSADAATMSDLGYRVASYEWSPRGAAGGSLVPGVLAPKHGTLTVTYERRTPPVPGDHTQTLRAAPPGVAAELIDLLNARAEGVIDERQFSRMRKRLVRP